ncbi:MAG: hypothetical protein AAF225_00670, partial [Pseudomonadota bacterium]
QLASLFNLPIYPVIYEQLTADPHRVMKQLFAELDFEHHEINVEDVKLKKQSNEINRKFAETIRNDTEKLMRN